MQTMSTPPAQYRASVNSSNRGSTPRSSSPSSDYSNVVPSNSTVEATIPSVGDVLMLSQVAWRIARTFTPVTEVMPPEFPQISAEMNAVSKALKLLAETLFNSNTEVVLGQTDRATASAIAVTIDACKRTIDDLESLVDHYQVTRKTTGVDGYSITRTWSTLVLSNYMSMMWTTEGGNMHDLRDTLRIHKGTLNLIRQALESGSPHNVEKTSQTIAEEFTRAYGKNGRDIRLHIDRISDIIDALAGNEETFTAPRLERVSSIRSYRSMTGGGGDIRQQFIADARPPSATHSPMPSPRVLVHDPFAQPLSLDNVVDKSVIQRSLTVTSNSESISSVDSAVTVGADEFPSVGGLPSRNPKRPILTPWPPQIPAKSPQRTLTNRSIPRLQTLQTTHLTVEDNIDGSRRRSMSQPDLPNFAKLAVAGPDDAILPVVNKLSLTPRLDPSPVILPRSTSTRSQQDKFEKAFFKNSAILCDLDGTTVEFTRPEGLGSHELVLEEAMTECRICVVRRMEAQDRGQSVFTTSIWAFSKDGSVRMQLMLPHPNPIIPYPSYFSPLKISVAVPHCPLSFYSVNPSTPPTRVLNTDWTNFHFATPVAANEFQNQLYGRRLLASFRTERTTKLFEKGIRGIGNALKSEEQMCGMEYMRLWEDEGSGAVIAMLHFSAIYKPGYMCFYINSKENPITIKEGEKGESKQVKVRGLNIPISVTSPVASPTSPIGNPFDKSNRMITGARFHFASPEEATQFMTWVHKLQVNLIEGLPLF